MNIWDSEYALLMDIQSKWLDSFKKFTELLGFVGPHDRIIYFGIIWEHKLLLNFFVVTDDLSHLWVYKISNTYLLLAYFNVCVLVSQSVKYEALGFSVIGGKLNVCARASFEILQK